MLFIIMFLVTTIVGLSVGKGYLLTVENASIVYYDVDDMSSIDDTVLTNPEVRKTMLSTLYQNGFENVSTKDLISIAISKASDTSDVSDTSDSSDTSTQNEASDSADTSSKSNTEKLNEAKNSDLEINEDDIVIDDVEKEL